MALKTSQIGDLLPCTNEDLNDILSNILNLNINMMDNSSEKHIASAINGLLSSSRTRQQGLEYLNLVIDNCTQEVISENALSWANHCLVKYPGDNLKEIKLITIGKIVSNASRSPDFSKRFVSDYLSKVLEMCLTDHNNPNELGASLDALTVCMKSYSSWFGNHKGKLEPFLLKFFEQKSSKLVDKAANAFLYLQQIGNAGLEGVNHKTNFSNAVSKLCATLQHLYVKFFENDAEFDVNEYNVEQEGFTLSAFDWDSQKMTYITARRIVNCLKFLMIMLRKSFPVCKEIKPEEVLDVIRCGLNLHRCLEEGDNSLEDYQTAVLLIDVQTQCLQLLRILIVWGQSHLIPYAHTISKVLIDALSMSQKCSCFTSNSVFQETVYKTLCTWIRVAKSGFHPHFQDYLVTHILHDIIPARSTVTLNIDTDLNNIKSKKAKRKAVQDKVIASSIQNNNESQTTLKLKNKEDVCAFALNTLKQLLIATDLKIKTVLLKEIYSVITGTLLDLSYSKLVHPYTNPVCQERLYEVLVSFYEQPTLNIYPHLQLVLTILNQGVAHHNRHIAITCEQGLSSLEKLCQPLYPPLYTSLPGEEHQENSNLDVSFKSYTREVNGDDEAPEEDAVCNGIPTDDVQNAADDLTSPACSLETEVVDNGVENNVDNLQDQENRSQPSKIIILKSEIISQQHEDAPININESSELLKVPSPIQEVSNDEPCLKKIKLSPSEEELKLKVFDKSLDIKAEEFSQEHKTQADKSPYDDTKIKLETVNFREISIQTSFSSSREVTEMQVVTCSDRPDTSGGDVCGTSTQTDFSTIRLDTGVQAAACHDEPDTSSTNCDISTQMVEEERGNNAETATVEEAPSAEDLEDSFIDEVKDY